MPGRPANLADSRARAYCACSGCGSGLFGHFYSHLSPSLWDTVRYRLKYWPKGPLNPKQKTSQPFYYLTFKCDLNLQIKLVKLIQKLAESEPKAYPKHQRETKTTNKKITDDKSCQQLFPKQVAIHLPLLN